MCLLARCDSQIVIGRDPSFLQASSVKSGKFSIYVSYIKQNLQIMKLGTFYCNQKRRISVRSKYMSPHHYANIHINAKQAWKLPGRPTNLRLSIEGASDHSRLTARQSHSSMEPFQIRIRISTIQQHTSSLIKDYIDRIVVDIVYR